MITALILDYSYQHRRVGLSKAPGSRSRHRCDRRISAGDKYALRWDRALPSGDPFLEKVRTRYEIPERIPILSPHGGSSIIAFIFDSEQLPVMKRLMERDIAE